MSTPTTFTEIICDFAMVQIADVRLQTEMSVSPARFFRKMSFFVTSAIPRFNRPPEAREWLKFTAPVYDDMGYNVPMDYDGGTLTIESGIKGYGLVSIIRMDDDGFGQYDFTPIPVASYDETTGNITVNSGYVKSGDMLSIDFYTDGVFDRALGYDIKDILGLLIQYVWEFRFANDYLIQQPKIKDKSFDVGNEANYMRAATERMRMLSVQINQRLREFEQNVEYRNKVLQSNPDTVYAPENT